MPRIFEFLIEEVIDICEMKLDVYIGLLTHVVELGFTELPEKFSIARESPKWMNNYVSGSGTNPQ